MWDKSRRNTKLSVAFSHILAVLLLISCDNATALTSSEYTFDELVAQADQILVGTVSEINSFWGEGRGSDTIFSDIRLIELEQVKGEIADTQFTLKVVGGVVGDQAQFYPGLPQFVSGQRYLLFIKGNNRAMFPIAGVSQGVYHIQWNADQQRSIAIPSTQSNTQTLSRNIRSLSHNHDEQQGRDLTGLISDIRASMAQGQ